MKNIGEYLCNRYGTWGWMGQRAHDAAAINKILPLDFIISCDYGLDVPYYFCKDNVFSVEKKIKIRKDWSNEDLKTGLSGDFGKAIYRKWSKEEKDINLLCYRSVKRLEQNGRNMKNKLNIFAVSEDMKSYFDNKVMLYKELDNLSLPRIPGDVMKVGEHKFSDLSLELGLPFVVQFPYGSSGHFTFIIREEKQYETLRSEYPETNAVVRKYVDGVSLNINAVIVTTDKGVKVCSSFPSVQIVGIKECSNFSSAFCGNDYSLSQNLDKAVLGEVKKCVDITGKWMHSKGFHGIFGMDFLIEGGTVYPVEINPRFQNSTSLHNALNILSGNSERAIFLLHIAKFLQEDDKVIKEYINNIREEDLFSPVNGAQLIVHNKNKDNIATGNLVPGVYRNNGDEIEFVRNGAVLMDCEEDEDILITCGVPPKYTKIEPNAPICKIQTRKNILSSENEEKLVKSIKETVDYVYHELRLMDPSSIEQYIS